MGWTELLEKVNAELDAEAEKLRMDADEKRKSIIGEAEIAADEKIKESRLASFKEAKMLYDEIVSIGRIKAKSIVRQSGRRSIDRIYDEFKEKLLKDGRYKKNLVEKFLAENYRPDCEVFVSKEMFSLLDKGQLKRYNAKAGGGDCAKPAVIKWGRVTVSFDWDEFIEKFKEETLGEVYKTFLT